jgi:hypothetical protein
MSPTKILVCLLAVSLCGVLVFSGCGPQERSATEPSQSVVAEPEKSEPAQAAETQAPEPEKTPAEPAQTQAAEPEKPATSETAEQTQPKAEKSEQAPKPGAVGVAFNFSVGDVTRYKVTTEDEDSVEFKGKWPKEGDFENKRNNARVELDYTQRIESLDDDGNAVAKIAIDAVRASYVNRNLPAYDFDSRRETDKKKAMYRLLGKSYTIKLAPTGRFLEVVDASAAQAAVSGKTADEPRAAALVTNEAIEQRHGFLIAPDPGDNMLAAGDTWSTVRSFSFRMLGTKIYERIYTLKDIEEAEGHKIGVVEMKAIPSAEGAEALHQQGQTPDISQMADNAENYYGEMRFDLTSGKVQEYVEKLVSNWTILDTSAEEAEPPALVMAAVRVSRVDKLN